MRLLASVCVAVCVGVLLLGRGRAEWAECGEGLVRCGDSQQCVYISSLCIGWSQCQNGWDALHCTSCQGNSFLCDGSRCVHNNHKCDGVAWCNDGADEANCTSIKQHAGCTASSRCNGVQGDCIFNDDELLCTPEMCRAPATKDAYSGGRCRDPNARCNGVLNFPDEKDEDNCTECKGGALFCDGRCVPANELCDGYFDCSCGQDELHCTSCKGNSFLCDGKHCVDKTPKCFGTSDCQDGAGQAINCTSIQNVPTCKLRERCNGVWNDVRDRSRTSPGDDELDCYPEMCQAPATKDAYFGGRCRDPNAKCNGMLNFPDEQDEENCTECTGGLLLCDGRCVPANELCDGHARCSNGEDELHCTSCQENSFLCDGSHCVHNFHKCDGVVWCNDGADEANCTSIRSVPNSWATSRCNGEKGNIWSGDDELYCTPEMCQAPANSSTYCDGRCLPASSWCDGIADCSDGQDEAGCAGTLSS